MAIEVTCTSCHRTMMLKDSCAGKKGPCPHCKSVLEVPAVAVTPMSKAGEVEAKESHHEFLEPTQPQVAYAQKLGVEIPAGISRRELSDLIDVAKENSPATESQKEFLRDLGIKCPPNIKANQISMLLDAATTIRHDVMQGVYEQLKESGQILEHASEEVILDELRNRGKFFFIFMLDDDEFRYQEKLPMKGQLRWCDGLNQSDVQYIIASMAIGWARNLDMTAYADEFDGSPPSLEFKASEIKNDGPVVHLNIEPKA